jgi:hypothetical protein
VASESPLSNEILIAISEQLSNICIAQNQQATAIHQLQQLADGDDGNNALRSSPKRKPREWVKINGPQEPSRRSRKKKDHDLENVDFSDITGLQVCCILTICAAATDSLIV